MTKYPLAWPPGWPRTPAGKRIPGPFRVSKDRVAESKYTSYRELSMLEASQRVVDELRRFGVPGGDSIVSTNIKLRLDGFPRGDQPMPADPGVAVYWRRPDDRQTKCMAIDIYNRVEHNIAGIAATLHAMRAIERHGGSRILDRAFEGFIALPAGQKPWRQVFGFADDEKISHLRLEGAYRTARSEAHPDRPEGTEEKFRVVQQAYEAACRELGFQP